MCLAVYVYTLISQKNLFNHGNCMSKAIIVIIHIHTDVYHCNNQHIYIASLNGSLDSNEISI